MLTLRLHCVYTAPTTRTPTTRTLHCTASPRAPCPGAPLAAAAVVRQRLPLRLPLRAPAQPGGCRSPLGDRTAAGQECPGGVPHAECREVGCRPRSALTPGALRAAREVESVRERDSQSVEGERPAGTTRHPRPGRCLGCSREALPYSKPTDQPSPILPSYHTQDAALARDLSTQSGALTGRFAGGSSAGVQGYAYQNAQGP